MNEAQRRDQFLSLVRNRMDPALRGADYDRCFNSVRAERPDLLDNRAAPTLAIANSFDPSQPRDDQGQWTTSEGFTAEPLGKKITLDSEVVWKDEKGIERHGQLGFHEQRRTQNGNEIRSERTGNTFVREVRVEHGTDQKTGRKMRKLVRIGDKDILVPTVHLRQTKEGFKAKDHL